ncbi:MAG: four helix bundle protein [Gemmatimonadales bacterium]
MTRAEFVERTKQFALAVVSLVEDLPAGRTADVIGRQLLRSGTSVGANYRAACRARSRREFIAKMGIVEEEADEAQFWIDILIERGATDTGRAIALRRDASQIVAMTVSSIRTARRAPRANPQSAFRNPQSTPSAIRNPQCS